MRPKVLLAIPVHNEERFLDRSITLLDSALTSTGWDYTLAISEDGSEDGTKEVIRHLTARYSRVAATTEPTRRGRGHAVSAAWARFDADVYAFTDADLPAGTTGVISVIRQVLCGAPVVAASRLLPESSTRRPPLRDFASKTYNAGVRAVFGDTVRDHQCGVKALSKAARDFLLPKSRIPSCFWDTELLVLATRSGIPVVQLPVRWVERRYNRTSIRRLMSDVVTHGAGVLELKSRLSRTRLGPEPTQRGTRGLDALRQG